MDNKFNNWILNKHVGKFTVVSNDYPKFFNDKFSQANIPQNGNNMAVNWDKIHPKYSLPYEFDGSKQVIISLLRNSEISKSEKIIVEFGYNQPIVSFEMDCFIENWYDIASFQGFVGTLCFTEDCSLIMEFSDRREYCLHSNFKI